MKVVFKKSSFIILFALFCVVATAERPSFMTQNAKAIYPLKSRAKINKNISENWAGYAASNGKYTEISGEWKVPNVKSAKNFEMDATWIGIGGVNTDDLIQSGTQAVTQQGRVTYQAWLEMLPSPSIPLPISINPNDVINARISLENSSKDKWLIELTNETTKKSVQKEISYNSSFSSAEWIEEAPSDENGVLPLDQFGNVRFSKAYAIKNGRTLSAGNCNATAIGLADASGKLLAYTGTLSQLGTSFLVNRTGNKQTIPKNRIFGPMSGWIHPHKKQIGLRN